MRTLISAFLLLAGSQVMAQDDCTLTIAGGDNMQFDKKEMTVSKSCSEVTVELTHSGNLGVAAMGHNWVLSTAADMQSIVNAGMATGLEQDYLPADTSNIIAHTDMIGGGETSSVTFSTEQLEAGGSYKFYCTFPGHAALMVGDLIVKE